MPDADSPFAAKGTRRRPFHATGNRTEGKLDSLQAAGSPLFRRRLREERGELTDAYHRSCVPRIIR